MTTSNEKNIR